MQSRQIQVFGFIGSAVLILFIVIFLGQDFHRLFLKYSENLPFSSVSDAQVAKEASAAATSAKHIAEKAVIANRDDNKKSVPVMQPAKEAAAEANMPAKVAAKSETVQKSDAVQALTTKQKEKVPAVAKVKEPVVASDMQKPAASPVPSDPSAVNKEIRTILGTVPFFRHSMALTSKNKAVLDSVVKRLGTLPYPYTLDVEGHTEAGIAAGVSETMAARVEAYLRRKLPGVTIRTIGYADAYPIIDDPKNKENRRVEIIVRRSDG